MVRLRSMSLCFHEFDIRSDRHSAAASAQARIYREAGACPVWSSGL